MSLPELSLVLLLFLVGILASGVWIAVGLGLFMLVGSFLQQGDISWFPLTGGIDDPLARYAPSVQR